MNIGRISGGKSINIWEIQKRAIEKRLEKIGKETIKSEPTKDQLDFINNSKEQEKDIQSVAQLPIDWEHVKETINLTDEERELRYEQDTLKLDLSYYTKMSKIEDEYQKNMKEIRKKGEIEQKNIELRNKTKANAIITKIEKGMMVSSLDMIFVNEFFPEELAKAIRKAKNNNENDNKDYITDILNSLDYRI